MLEAELQVSQFRRPRQPRPLSTQPLRLTKHRGEILSSPLAPLLRLSSPSFAPDSETRHREMNKFLEDLKQVAALL